MTPNLTIQLFRNANLVAESQIRVYVSIVSIGGAKLMDFLFELLLKLSSFFNRLLLPLVLSISSSPSSISVKP